MRQLRNRRNGVVVKVDDDTAKRLETEGWEPATATKKAEPASTKSTTRKPRK